MTEKDVIISIKGAQTDEEPIELITAGVYARQDGVHILKYSELPGDDEGEALFTTIRVEGDSVSGTLAFAKK